MDRWGKATVLVARAVPLARSAVSLPAGLARFPFLPFVVLTTIGFHRRSRDGEHDRPAAPAV